MITHVTGTTRGHDEQYQHDDGGTDEDRLQELIRLHEAGASWNEKARFWFDRRNVNGRYVKQVKTVLADAGIDI